MIQRVSRVGILTTVSAAEFVSWSYRYTAAAAFGGSSLAATTGHSVVDNRERDEFSAGKKCAGTVFSQATVGFSCSEWLRLRFFLASNVGFLLVPYLQVQFPSQAISGNSVQLEVRFANQKWSTAVEQMPWSGGK